MLVMRSTTISICNSRHQAGSGARGSSHSRESHSDLSLSISPTIHKGGVVRVAVVMIVVVLVGLEMVVEKVVVEGWGWLVVARAEIVAMHEYPHQQLCRERLQQQRSGTRPLHPEETREAMESMHMSHDQMRALGVAQAIPNEPGVKKTSRKSCMLSFCAET